MLCVLYDGVVGRDVDLTTKGNVAAWGFAFVREVEVEDVSKIDARLPTAGIYCAGLMLNRDYGECILAFIGQCVNMLGLPFSGVVE